MGRDPHPGRLPCVPHGTSPPGGRGGSPCSLALPRRRRRTPTQPGKVEGCPGEGQRRGSVRTPGLDPGLLIGGIEGVPVGPWMPGDSGGENPSDMGTNAPPPHKVVPRHPGPGRLSPHYWPTCARRGRGHAKLEAPAVGGGGAPTSRRVSHSPRAPNPGPIFSLHRLWVIEPPPPAGGAGRPGEPGSGPGTAALQTPSPARHLPLPPRVASHPWPRSQATRARPLCNDPGGVWGGGGCARGCPRGPLLSPSFLQGDPPRSAGSTLQLRPHPTSLDVFNTWGSGLSFPQSDKWLRRQFLEAKAVSSAEPQKLGIQRATDYPEDKLLCGEHVDASLCWASPATIHDPGVPLPHSKLFLTGPLQPPQFLAPHRECEGPCQGGLRACLTPYPPSDLGDVPAPLQTSLPLQSNFWCSPKPSSLAPLCRLLP